MSLSIFIVPYGRTTSSPSPASARASIILFDITADIMSLSDKSIII